MKKGLIFSVLLIAALAIVAPAAAGGSNPLAGAWHRLNPDISNPTSEHEVLRCGGRVSWNCRYDKQPEPTLGFEHPPDATSGRFRGVDITSGWGCPLWFPAGVCDAAIYVVRGEMTFSPPGGPDFAITQELVVTDSEGDQRLYVYWVDTFVCPWFGSFADALAANPLPVPAQDCTFAP